MIDGLLYLSYPRLIRCNAPLFNHILNFMLEPLIPIGTMTILLMKIAVEGGPEILWKRILYGLGSNLFEYSHSNILSNNMLKGIRSSENSLCL